MTTGSLYGLGSFVLFLFTSSLFGFVLILLMIRHLLLIKETKETRRNSLILQAALIPFIFGIIGLIALELFDDNLSVKKLFDQYLAITMICVSLLLAILYILLRVKKLTKSNLPGE